MKKKKKGTTGFVIGIVIYILMSMITLFSSIGAFASAEDASRVEAPMLVLVGCGSVVVFISLTLWFLSFTVGYNQRKSQIELLEEMNSK